MKTYLLKESESECDFFFLRVKYSAEKVVVGVLFLCCSSACLRLCHSLLLDWSEGLCLPLLSHMAGKHRASRN